LRWFRLWRTIGWLLVAAVVVASVAPAPTLPDVGIPDKTEHALTYFMLTLWFCGVYADRGHSLIGVVFFVLGALLEGIQALTATRSPEVADLIANTAGILAALALATAGLDRWCAMVESFLKPNR
jgi:VanZ family protein